MPVKQSEGLFFITFTCYKWMPLIDITNSYKLVYKWFEYLKSRGHFITGYVIMPNHVHALIGFRNVGKSINKIVGDGKRFMAYDIIKRLQAAGENSILDQLMDGVETMDKARSKKHEVWEASFDWKECRTAAFAAQKLAYMHHNPCTGKWNLAQSPVGYVHSSAHFYLTSLQGTYSVTNVAELDDVDLTGNRGL